jgi:hypothetical protein
LLSETRNRKLDADNKRLGKKAEACRAKSARNANGSYIVLGGERMRLVMRQETDQTSSPGIAGKIAMQEEYAAVPVDNEGNDLMTGEATADRKRKRVKVHDTLVTVLRGSFKKRKGLDGLSVGGWEYTFYALLHEYLHEASGGHAAGTKEAQRLTQDLDRRSIATAITVEEGAHTVKHDKETNVHQRPSYRTMTEKVYPAFNLLQCVLAFKRALAETDFTSGPDGKLGRLLRNPNQKIPHHGWPSGYFHAVHSRGRRIWDSGHGNKSLQIQFNPGTVREQDQHQGPEQHDGQDVSARDGKRTGPLNVDIWGSSSPG